MQKHDSLNLKICILIPKLAIFEDIHVTGTQFNQCVWMTRLDEIK